MPSPAYDYATGVGAGVAIVPGGMKLLEASVDAGALAATLAIGARPPITVPPFTAFSPTLEDAIEPGPVIVTIGGGALSWVVAWDVP